MTFLPIRAKSAAGIPYRFDLPVLPEAGERFGAFYQSLRDAYARADGDLSSVVATAEGEQLGDRFASVRYEITAFSGGAVAWIAVRSQVWDLERDILLDVRDIGLTGDRAEIRDSVRMAARAEGGFCLRDHQLCFWEMKEELLHAKDLRGRRRSDLRMACREIRLPLARAALFAPFDRE